MNVLYLLGCNEGPSKRYRVFNHIEALKLLDIKAEWIWDIDSRLYSLSFLSRFSICVVFRSGWNDRVEKLYGNLRELGIPIVYDIDDLVFDPEVVEHIDAYRRMRPEAQVGYMDGVKSIRRALTESDYLTTSTNFLADYLKRLFDRPTYVVPFGLNQRQLEVQSVIEEPFSGGRFIGYLSGTNSHHADFAEAAPALRRILTEYDDVFLRLVGYLDVEEHLPSLEHKIVRVEFMDWSYLVLDNSVCYVNLAPFEVDSLFCKCKSELKFVEAAQIGVPVVASAVPSFCDVIENGVNGFVARTTDEWYLTLKRLLDDRSLQHAVARNARLTAAQNYHPMRIGARLREVYFEIQSLHAERGVSLARDIAIRREVSMVLKKKGLRIAWVIPQPFEGSGGHRNIFRAIRHLSDFGHSCSVHVLPDNHRFSKGEEVEAFINSEFFNLHAESVHWGVDALSECDVMVCTYWTTAYVVERVKDKSALQIYFLQDFEPMFFPMGVDYVRAMATYKLGFYPLTSGPWPLQMLKENLQIDEGDFFRFPLDRGTYFKQPDSSRPDRRRVVFFARPDMPRRCYTLGVLALEILAKQRPDVEILFYGARSDKYTGISFEFTNLGMTETIQELGDLYRSADVGLCFSTTNPSLVPFEMMACGLPVVDLDVNGNEVNYGSRDNCVLVEPLPEAIAEGIVCVLENDDLRQKLSDNGVRFTESFPTEIEMAKRIEHVIVEQHRKRRGQCESIEARTYMP